MKIQVHGKQMDVGDALRGHAENRLSEMVNKYSARPVEATLTFSKDRHEFLCDATVHLATGLTTQAKSHASDIYDSFDKMLDRMETQLRRYKQRLKNHHISRTVPVEMSAASSYVLAGKHGADDENEPESLQPVIIAEMAAQIPSLSVGEAVMQMELVHAGVLVFHNSAHGGVNVVYRRDDGNVGWIDPRNQI